MFISLFKNYLPVCLFRTVFYSGHKSKLNDLKVAQVWFVTVICKWGNWSLFLLFIYSAFFLNFVNYFIKWGKNAKMRNHFKHNQVPGFWDKNELGPWRLRKLEEISSKKRDFCRDWCRNFQLCSKYYSRFATKDAGVKKVIEMTIRCTDSRATHVCNRIRVFSYHI